jgi:5-methylcytosine-specific restriction endonuclease McrA
MEKLLCSLQPVCVLCGSSADLTIDHVRPASKGYGLQPGNAARLCRPCNRRKSDKDLLQLPRADREKLVKAAEDFAAAFSKEAKNGEEESETPKPGTS